ncbi:MAG TPA: hypothetical protein VGW78_03660 [Candidatus Babeliales bacterium]|jgi:hypothetical protein|nr:hypothetical protein [Candidatus Babeliales bacterium]
MKNNILLISVITCTISWHSIAHNPLLSVLKYSCNPFRYIPTTKTSTNQNQSTGNGFSDLFKESIEDGFFGGVQWGIAACFYQLLYELASECISIIPLMCTSIKRLSAHIFNVLAKRPPAIDMHTLSILTQLLCDTNAEFEEVFTKKEYSDACKQTYKETLRTLCLHLIDYLQTHYAHYADNADQRAWLIRSAQTFSPYDTREIAFIITFIIKNLTSIVERIDTNVCTKEITRTIKANLLSLGRLNALLHGGIRNTPSSTIQTSWFSGK